MYRYASVFVAILLLGQRAHAQVFVPRGDASAFGVALGARFGSSVAASSDGSTVVVGAPGLNGQIGAGVLWGEEWGWWNFGATRSLVALDKNWVPFPALHQGASVSISGNGLTTIVGGPGDPGATGSAWAFAYMPLFPVVSAQVPFDLPTQSDLPPDADARGQACAVAISEDGGTAIVSGMPQGGSGGSALLSLLVYNRKTTPRPSIDFVPWPSSWENATPLPSPFDSHSGGGGSTWVCFSVAISNNGNTIIAGWPSTGASDGSNRSDGGAWVWHRDTKSSPWSLQSSNLISALGPPIPKASSFGTSVAISRDGNTAIVGAPNDFGGGGAAWVFRRIGNAWQLDGTQLAASATAAAQGTSVAISGDGKLAVVGGPNDDSGAGAAWVYKRYDTLTKAGRPTQIGGWRLLQEKLIPQHGFGLGLPKPKVAFGSSVAISANGDVIVIGGPNDVNGTGGGAWVFVSSTSIGNHVSFLDPPPASIRMDKQFRIKVQLVKPDGTPWQQERVNLEMRPYAFWWPPGATWKLKGDLRRSTDASGVAIFDAYTDEPGCDYQLEVVGGCCGTAVSRKFTVALPDGSTPTCK